MTLCTHRKAAHSDLFGLECSVVQWLLKQPAIRANINAIDGKGATALHLVRIPHVLAHAGPRLIWTRKVTEE